ncbi:MAG: FtsX-like permease family protein [Balneola sp.]|nr:MAG: FtsX-like permease family protein [Balneola sp.]
MFKNYLKIAFRNLFKYKSYSAINIFGLSVGVACCLLILLYLVNEFSYDRFHTDSDRIYRSWVLESYDDGGEYWSTTSPLRFKELFEDNIPEAELVARRYIYNDLVRIENQEEGFSEPVQLVDPEFFEMFDFELIEGSSSSVFAQPTNVVLTPSSAKRFFGEENPMNKTLLVKMGDEFQPFTVSGIIEEAPSNSSLRFELLIPMENASKLFSPGAFDAWYSVIPETYVQFTQNADISQVEQSLITTAKRLMGEEEWNRSQYTIGLQSITDIRHNPDIPAGIATVIDPDYLYILSGIAFLVLLIACVNFITLSISRSTSRAKEVGIRKTIGAERTHLMYQFWGEAILMTLFSIVVGLIASELMLPYFNELAGTQLDISTSLDTILLVLGLTAFISLIAGIYPALILSGFKPIEVLKGKIQVKKDKSWFRTGMVVFQFSLSIFLIAATFTITDQLDYLQSRDLGFQKEHLLVLQVDDNPNQETGFMGLMERTSQKEDRLRSQINSIPGILDISSSLFTPADNVWMNVDYRDSEGTIYDFNVNIVDADYPELMGLEFVEGRSFSDQMSSDEQQAIIVNEAFVKLHGWDDALNGQFASPDFSAHEIVGVVKDFNYASLRNEIEPLALVINPAIIFSGVDNVGLGGTSPNINLRISSADVPRTIAALETSWESVSGGEPFNYIFLDQAVDSRYRQEERLSKIATFGAGFAILIACLGLFGLASLTVVRRTKEIGVRKVLGASSSRIIYLINREFTMLMLAAMIVSTPIIWYGMSSWLSEFAYRININIWTMFLAGGITLIIAWLTVGYQSFKAATINPVESLKNE